MKSVTYTNGKVVPWAKRTKSDIVFIDAGAREGELFHYPDCCEANKGSFFKHDEKKLEVREDLGSHVDYSYMPFPFSIDRSDFTGAEIHLFEPNSDFWERLNLVAEKISHVAASVTLHQSAVWNENTKKSLLLTDGGWGSSLCPDKINENFNGSEVTVDCIDFAEFIKSLDSKEVHIKMDIEGAEYDVVPSLFQHEIFLQKVHSLSVEFHRDFFPEKDQYFWYMYTHFIIALTKTNRHINWWPGEW